MSATEIPLRFVLYGLRPSADALSLGIGWDAMGRPGMNIGVGAGVRGNWVVAGVANDREIERQELKRQLPAKVNTKGARKDPEYV